MADTQRRDKHNYYLDIAETVLERGTCLRRNYGAIIVNHDEIRNNIIFIAYYGYGIYVMRSFVGNNHTRK